MHIEGYPCDYPLNTVFSQMQWFADCEGGALYLAKK